MFCFVADSVFLRESEHHPGPDADGSLGQLKNELETDYPGRNARITEFVALGPKSYAYQIHDGKGELIKQVCKIKGLKMGAVGVRIGVDQLRDIIKNHSRLSFPQRKFIKNFGSIHILDTSQEIGFTSNKRRIIDNSPTLDTLPFGHQ